MLRKTKEQQLSDEEVPSQHESDAESGESEIGLAKPVVTAPKKRKTEASASTAPAGRTAGPSGGQKRKQDAEVDAALKSADACVSALRSFKPIDLGQGTLKVKDVDKRLQLSFQAIATLEEFMEQNAAVQEHSTNLSQAASLVSDWMDVMIPFTVKDSMLDYAKDMDSLQILKFVKTLPVDCMHSILVAVGKRWWQD